MNLSLFVSGIFMATFAASGVFFLKFWRASRDRFFLYFCLACWLLATERIALLFVPGGYASDPMANEGRSMVQIFRLAAFALILIAVINKNRNAHRP
jgi:hypothetical protein